MDLEPPVTPRPQAAEDRIASITRRVTRRTQPAVGVEGEELDGVLGLKKIEDAEAALTRVERSHCHGGSGRATGAG